MSGECTPQGSSSQKLRYVTIKNITCDFGQKKWRFWEKYYIQVSMGDAQTSSTSKQTKSDRAFGSPLKWSQSFYFSNAHDDTDLTLTLYRVRSNGSSILVGSFSDSVQSLMGEADDEVTIDRDLSSDVGIRIQYTASSHSTLIKQGNDAITVIQKERPLATFLEFTEMFQRLTEPIAEVHPWAKMAHKMLFGVLELIDGQIQLDDNVSTLFDSFSCFYEVVREIEKVGLPKDDRRRGLLRRLGLQMADIVYFVCDYCKIDKFAKRIYMNALTNTKSTIEEFDQILKALKDEFFATSAVQTEIKVTRILQVVEGLVIAADLNGMPHANGAGFELSKMCLAGTRVKMLEEIVNWVNSKNSDRIMLLLGGAGTGKSSIAHTVGNHFAELGRLGSFFSFSRNRPDNNLRIMLPHIARSLAERHSAFCASLAQTIKDTETRTTRDLGIQFEKFIREPAKALAGQIFGPIIIVIDALDEAVDDTERGLELLLEILSTKMTQLPSNFRILITSRAEEHVESTFKGQPLVRIIRMEDVSLTSTSSDIMKFVQKRLSRQSGALFEGIDKTACKELVRQSDGLFQWAHVVCEFIRTKEFGTNYSNRYTSMMEASGNGRGVAGDKQLDSPYHTVLSHIISPGNGTRSIDPGKLHKFRVVMTRVLMAVEPLSMNSLNQFLGASETTLQGVDAGQVLLYFGSVMGGVTNMTSPVRLLHTSFRDFLTDRSRGGQFFVDIEDVPTCADMAQSLLRIMINELKFHIFSIASSYNSNPSYDLVKECIPQHLSYSCRFWANHLPPMSPNWSTFWDSLQYPMKPIKPEGLVKTVQTFLRECFLYWLEVQSVLRNIDGALNGIQKVMNWLQSPNGGSASAFAFANDAERFLACFAACIATSVPHIYLSALPFAPQESIVAKHYGRQVVQAISIETGRLERWPVCLNVINGHTGYVTSIAVSPDGTRIVSGSNDRTIRIWNAADGTPMCLPFSGYTDWVTSVAFSPDGTRIVSGSVDRMLRVWNASDGKLVVGPFEGHTNWVNSVAFSPDGTRIVSCGNFTIQVWNAANGLPLVGPFEGHTKFVRSVTFSPDGSRIASGSEDKTVRVWNAVDGTLALGPLEGHTSIVWSVAFSPDGNLIASGSDDRTIRVWHAANGALVTKPFRAHTLGINAIAFSPDGNCIISGSDDSTVRVWNVSNGTLVAEPFEGHNYSVISVAFSPDGTRIFSGSCDNTIRVWSAAYDLPVAASFTKNNDVDSFTTFWGGNTQIVSDFGDKTDEVHSTTYGIPATQPCRGHSGAVASVVLSPDGTCIASGSYDNTIEIWNAADGLPVTGPFLGHTGLVTTVAFSPDGTRLVSGSRDQTIRMWNTGDGTPVAGPFDGHTGWVNSVAFSPDGTHIVSGSHDMTVRVWTAADGLPTIEPIEGHTHFVWSVAFSPDGALIASGSGDNTVRVWNAADGSLAAGPFEGHTSIVFSVTFSPDGAYIASGSYDNTVRVWNTKDGVSIIEPFQGHGNCVDSVAFSPDGTRIVSGSRDLTVQVWNVTDGRLVAKPYQGHNGGVLSAVFSLDGTRIISGSGDNTIRVWNLVHDDVTVASSLQEESQSSGPAIPPLDGTLTKTFSSSCIQFNGFTSLKDGCVLGPDGELIL